MHLLSYIGFCFQFFSLFFVLFGPFGILSWLAVPLLSVRHISEP